MRDDHLFERTVWQPDAAFIPRGAITPERPHTLEDDWDVEVPRQGDLPPDLC
jgi:hypothetical protein